MFSLRGAASDDDVGRVADFEGDDRAVAAQFLLWFQFNFDQSSVDLAPMAKSLVIDRAERPLLHLYVPFRPSVARYAVGAAVLADVGTALVRLIHRVSVPMPRFGATGFLRT